jgi:hypothetical protein
MAGMAMITIDYEGFFWRRQLIWTQENQHSLSSYCPAPFIKHICPEITVMLNPDQTPAQSKFPKQSIAITAKSQQATFIHPSMCWIPIVPEYRV